MQSTGDFHDEIVIHFLGIAEDIFDNVTAFDASNDMLNDNPHLRNEGVLRALLRSGSLPSFRPAHGTDNRELRLSIDLRRIPRKMLETPASHQEEPDAWILRVSKPGLHYQNFE